MMGEMAYFPAYFSYARTLDSLTDEQFGHVMRAAMEYAENGTIPQLDALEKMGFAFIKEDIDRANERYKRVCEVNKRNIEKRWNAKKEAEGQSSDQDEAVTDTTVYDRMNGIRDHTTVYELYQSNSKSKGKSKSNGKSERDIDAAPAADTPAKKPTKKVFSPPTVEEVREYCNAQGYGTIDPEAFVDYYSANGWKVGNQPMKDWKATVRNWSRRDKERGITAAKPANTNSSFDTASFFEAALSRSYGDGFGFDTGGAT